MNPFGIQQAFTSWYGATVMFIIIAMSIYLVALILVRFNFFRRNSVDSDKLIQITQEALLKGDEKLLAELKGQRFTDPPLRILVGYGLANAHLNSPELSEVLTVVRSRQRERLSRGLAIFGTFAAIAPFIGLLGTVIGIVHCFQSLSVSGAAGPNVVASGVAEALWATAAGLVVAIPSVVAYNLFNNKAKRILTDMEALSRQLVLIIKGDKTQTIHLVGLKGA